MTARMSYKEVKGETREEYAIKLLAFGGQRVQRQIDLHGYYSIDTANAVDRWARIYALQVRDWEPSKPE